MDTWIIVAVVVGLLAIGGVAVVAAFSGEGGDIECESCGNSCTAENNCGLQSCGVVSGGGSCGCGR